MSYIPAVQVNSYIGDLSKADVKSIAHDFYNTMKSMLANYGDQNADLILPDGTRVSKDQKYEWYGTFLFTHNIDQLSSMWDGAFKNYNSMITNEKSASQLIGG